MSNKHYVTALVVLPLLSLLGWWAAGALTGAKPQPAERGLAYPLVEKSGCRYAGGLCELENVDVTLALTYVEGRDGPSLDLVSSIPLQGVLMAVGPPGDERLPIAMTASDEHGRQWRLSLQHRPGSSSRIRLVAQASGVTWFGEAGTVFLQPGSADDGLPGDG